MSSPSSAVRSRPRLFLPRFECSSNACTSPPMSTTPVDPSPRIASPRSTCSILTTSAPQSASSADAAGTKVCSATSRMRTSSITAVMAERYPILTSQSKLRYGGPMTRVFDFPVFDADNHMYETKEAFTRHLPDPYKGAIDYVEVNGRTKIVICGRISEYIPNPTFEVVAKPGAMEDFFRHGNKEGKDRRKIF